MAGESDKSRGSNDKGRGKGRGKGQGKGRGSSGKKQAPPQLTTSQLPSTSRPTLSTTLTLPQPPTQLPSISRPTASTPLTPGTLPASTPVSRPPRRQGQSTSHTPLPMDSQHFVTPAMTSLSSIRRSPMTSPNLSPSDPSLSQRSSDATQSPSPSQRLSPSISGFHIRANSGERHRSEDHMDDDSDDDDDDDDDDGSDDDDHAERTLDSHGRTVIKPHGKTFKPTKPATKAISKSIKSLYEGPCKSWRGVPYFLRDAMYIEFKKQCIWFPEHELQVRINFELKARARLTDLLATARNNNKKPRWIEQPWWDELWVYWKSPEFLKKSQQAKAARASAIGGSIHTGGARSMVDWQIHLEETNKRPYDPVDVFKHCHRYKARKGESEEQRRWACPRAETANLRYEQMLADLPAEVREKMTPEEREQMWLSCVGGVRKGHVYGMAGSSQNFFHRIESGLRGIETSAGVEALDREGMEALQVQVTKLTAEKEELTTKVGQLEAQMAMVLKHFMQPLPQHTWDDESTI